MGYEQKEIRERLQWLIKLRWVGCIGVFGVTHIVRDMLDLPFPMTPVYLILGFVALYNIYFQAKLRDMERDFRRDAVGQIILDFFVLAAAVYFSGGCDSPFLYYYIFHIVISGLLLSRGWTFRFAALAIALPTTVAGLKHLGILPHFAVFREEPAIYSNLLIIGAYGSVFISTILLTAYFVTYLAGKLQAEQKEIKRLYALSEKLRSSIIMDEVIAITKQELSLLTGKPLPLYLALDKSKSLLTLHLPSHIAADKSPAPAACGQVNVAGVGGGMAIPLSDDNIFTCTLLSGEPRMLDSSAVRSSYEDKVLKELMNNAREISVLPVMTSFTMRCSDYFHCPDNTGCPAYGSDDKRCWQISGTMCHGKKMATMDSKLNECLKCGMFAPVGVFVFDTARISRHDLAFDVAACMRLLDAASLAISNARLYEQTLELSEVDGLTEIRNRRTFLQVLTMELPRVQRYNKTFGLLMLDIDFFKNYNDTNGHPQGDVLLKTLAAIIKKQLRESDTPGRYGGEEFIMLLPETQKEESITIAERIRHAIEAWDFPRAERQPGGRITASIGVASYPEDGDTVEKLINAADDALYSAKSSGRNRVIAANRPDMLI